MVRGLDGYFYLYPYLACAVFKLHRASRKIPVVHSERETPLPIPNRAVKPFSADGTWGATPWESRSPPVLHRTDEFRAASNGGSSSFWGEVVLRAGGGRARVGLPLNSSAGESQGWRLFSRRAPGYKTLQPHPS